MPVPKKRHSNTRTNKRRANWKIKPVNFGACPACGDPILPHRACPSCGAYQGRQVIVKKEKKDKKEK
jgi:large subunit ribosomal protein L32